MRKWILGIASMWLFTPWGVVSSYASVATKAYVDQIISSLAYPQSDWAQQDENANDFIKNKPDIDAIISALESKAEITDTRFDTIPTTAPTGTPPTGRVYIWFN